MDRSFDGGYVYSHFGLILVVNHACNMRCRYCYTGEKFNRSMPHSMGQKAIDRALASLIDGGELELGFFGGEPLIEAPLVESLIQYARTSIEDSQRHLQLSIGITTNGTIKTPTAWRVLLDPTITLAISCDGLPAVHDLYRVGVDGKGTSTDVLTALKTLLDAKKPVRVVMVVRPDTAQFLTEGIEYLWKLGVREFEPSLDIWSIWTENDKQVLSRAIRKAVVFWRDHLPHISVGWFDEKAIALAQLPLPPTARCGFGAGEIAISPAGNLYPCERLVGADDLTNTWRLPGNCMDGKDFLQVCRAGTKRDPGCSQCSMEQSCNTTCRCTNFIRTGDIRRPDDLLCDWNQSCFDAVFETIASPPQKKMPIHLALIN